MKVPLAYPKIPSSADYTLKRCIAFEKIDGTNFHFCWNANESWHSFGVRRDCYPFTTAGNQEFNQAHPGLGSAGYYFEQVWSAPLDAFLRSKERYANAQVICFFEFFGSGSFAGEHRPSDHKELILFDVQVNDTILPPKEFLSDFSKFPIAKKVYEGKFNGQFVEDVRNGKFDVNEGVVIKGFEKGVYQAAKIKTHAYMERLKAKFGNDWESKWE